MFLKAFCFGTVDALSLGSEEVRSFMGNILWLRRGVEKLKIFVLFWIGRGWFGVESDELVDCEGLCGKLCGNLLR